MIEINNKKDCCGCYACVNICPKNAICMEEDEKGFQYPYINEKKCINCHLCEKVCPILNNTIKEKNTEVWAMYNNNLQERLNSSSGGIFALLASFILDKNGIVFGAMFDKEYNVYHSYIDDKKDIHKIQGSKYVQSIIGNSYKDVKRFLEEGRYVLFTGTSCQIEGLNHYLIKKYDKLYTQDIICHGVPSPKVWKKYLEYQKNNNSKIIKKISFRDKDEGWSSFGTKIEFNNKTYRKNHNEDLYMKAFLQNTCLRESCYDCKFKNKYRNSDITLADFWGVEKYMPEINDDNGVSLIIINTEKGKELFNYIKNLCTYKKANIEYIIKNNSAYISSVSKDKNYEEFYNNLDTKNFDVLVDKYVSKSKKTNIIKRIFKKILKK